MFYLSGNRKGKLLGVLDSRDNVEEFYTEDFLRNCGVDIIRLNKELEIGFSFKTDCFEITLVVEGDTIGWKLEALDGVSDFKNEAFYFGYPVISLAHCFSCYKEKKINVDGMCTNNVTNMRDMFAGCNNLTVLDLSSFNTSKVRNMGYMFYYCDNLISVNISSFNTGRVTDMTAMFFHCANLTSIDVSSFNISKVRNMKNMFHKCEKLISMDISNFHTSKVANLKDLFRACKNLIIVKTSDDVALYNELKNHNFSLLVPESLRIACKKSEKGDINHLCAKFKLLGIKGEVFTY